MMFAFLWQLREHPCEFCPRLLFFVRSACLLVFACRLD